MTCHTATKWFAWLKKTRRTMKLYGVIESFQDYKGADATLWGVKKTKEEARELIKQAASEVCYECEGMEDDELEKFVNEHYTDEEKTDWEFDDGDSLLKFHIDTTEIDL